MKMTKNNTRNKANTCPKVLLILEIMLPFYLPLRNMCILFPFKMHFESAYTRGYSKLELMHNAQKRLVHSEEKKGNREKIKVN